jgi:hypothetical protein
LPLDEEPSLECITFSSRVVPQERDLSRTPARETLLTLKNAGLAGIALVVVQSSDSRFAPDDLTIVDEGASDGRPGADSLLLDPRAQDQLRAAAEEAQRPHH